ncbi:kinetochore protein SPC25 homolog isoform X1 [Solanum pennellii]|uniref:Kinetochore protein SPC25 n=1 Tax=Solanum pennellii TaxID=28526 RepID=A0ABM1V5F1_SOLPN|nr:kinetochore protein SPC25 homolog isoform X1 [Solanum pennellii]
MKMKISVGEITRNKMEELRLVCDREILIQQQRIDAATGSFKKSLDSTKTQAQETLQLQSAKLGKLKVELRELEDKLVKALAAKTRKEAKQIAIADSISSTKYRVEELRGVVENQRARKDEYAAIISQQADELKACEEKHNQTAEQREDIEEAIVWYNKVLGLRIECGHGVKFVFTNIDANNQDKEYFFTIRHENDVYTLIECDPQLNDAKELLRELNTSNGLFKFVRTMREKFQAAVTHGTFPDMASRDQDTFMISVSAPVSSISTDSRSEFLSQQEHQSDEHNRNLKKVDRAKGSRAALLSPGSASSLRRSPRFKVKR